MQYAEMRQVMDHVPTGTILHFNSCILISQIKKSLRQLTQPLFYPGYSQFQLVYAGSIGQADAIVLLEGAACHQ